MFKFYSHSNMEKQAEELQSSNLPTQSKDAPIGVFDSGLGGLSVWREIAKVLPNESIWYYADSGNCPYGNRSKEELLMLSIKIVEFLLQKQCKLIVVACNTATSAAIDYLRANYKVPFVGIEPAIKPAATHTQTRNIGILATKGTLSGQLYQQTFHKNVVDIEVHTQIGEGLVEIVENQEMDTPKAQELVYQYVKPMLDENVDKIVLGCTHYPFLIPAIKKIIPPTVEIINPAPAVALQTKRLLTQHQLLNNEPPVYHFITTGDKEKLKTFLDRLKCYN